eukprot:4297812-Prymnesium_polylepis.1
METELYTDGTGGKPDQSTIGGYGWVEVANETDISCGYGPVIVDDNDEQRFGPPAPRPFAFR